MVLPIISKVIAYARESFKTLMSDNYLDSESSIHCLKNILRIPTNYPKIWIFSTKLQFNNFYQNK